MNSRLSSYFFFVLLLGTTAAAVLVFLPFLTPIVLAIAVAVVLHPVYGDIIRLIGAGKIRKNLAAFVTVLLVLVIVMVPLFFLAGSIYSEVQTLYALLTDEANRSEVINALNSASQYLSNAVFGVLPAHSFDAFNITSYMKKGLEWLFTNLDMIFGSLAVFGGYVLVFLLSLFYLLRDGVELKNRVLSWSPQLTANQEFITRSFKKGILSVLSGTVAVSVLEGISTGLAFYVFGIPAPALWGTVALVASVVPGFGTSLIILPGVAYLLLTGNYVYGVGLLIWGYAAIIGIDHFLGPLLVNKGVHLHPFLVLLSVLGGIFVFGIVGFVMGPLILVFLVTLLEIYKTSVGDERAI
jgi:predicted PurR-regulated permease PerM